MGLLLRPPRLLGGEHQRFKCKGNFNAFTSAPMGFVVFCCPLQQLGPASVGHAGMALLGCCVCVGLGRVKQTQETSPCQGGLSKRGAPS